MGGGNYEIFAGEEAVSIKKIFYSNLSSELIGSTQTPPRLRPN